MVLLQVPVALRMLRQVTVAEVQLIRLEMGCGILELFNRYIYIYSVTCQCDSCIVIRLEMGCGILELFNRYIAVM